MHEDLTESVVALHLDSRHLDVTVHHYGYVDGQEHNERRNEFYGRLVRRKVQENPDDWKAALELAYVLIQVPVLEKLCVQSLNRGIASRARVMLAKLYVEDGREEEASIQLEKSVAENPEWIFNWTTWIQLLLHRKQYETAESALRRAQKRFGETPLLLRHECQLLVNTRRIVEAIPVGRRVTELVPSLPQYAELADKCEDLASRAGLLTI